MNRPGTLAATVLLASMLAAGPVQAVDLGLGLRAGTQGVGVEGGITATKFLTVRVGLYGLDVDESFEEGGIRYDGELQVGGAGALADFFPMRGTFRLTAGLFSNRNEISLVATPTQPQQIGGTIYLPGQVGTLSGVVEFDDTAPYLGVGWGNVARGGRVGFLCDLGVLAQGSGKVSLTSSNGGVNQSDLDAEAREIEAEIRDYDLWPVVSFGLAVRF